MKRWRLFHLVVTMVAMPIGTFVGMQFAYQSVGQNTFRKIDGLPSGYRLWLVTTYENHLFVIEGGQVDPKRWEPQLPLPLLFRAFRVDPVMERVVEEIKTKHIFAQSILAEREQRRDSWLAQDYEYWLFDDKTNAAFAVKPTRWQETARAQRYSHVEVIDLSTRQVKKIIGLLPEASFGTFALHPNKAKLYISVWGQDIGGLLWIYSTTTLERIKTIELRSDHTIKDIHFSKDGRYFFGSLGARGIAIIDTEEDKLMGWINPPEDRLYTVSIALSSDDREIYVGLGFALKKGGIAAIDVEKRQIVRTLELSPTGCISVAKVGEKLFAACLDGVYVIDISQWRGQ
ncbi:MAG: hypothetical protein QXQ50_07435 [Candidatus Bathyarchaeia archaeon]